MKAKLFNGNIGTSSEYWTVIIVENNGEYIRATEKYFVSDKKAKAWTKRLGYELWEG